MIEVGVAGLMMSPVVFFYKLGVRLRQHRHSFATSASAPGAFIEIEDKVIIEDHPLLVQYDAVAGGALKKGHENHLRNQTEQILIVHRICPPDKPFTCNRRVVVSDVFGHSTGRYPHAKQVVALESLPAGAPNGGSRSLFPARVAHFLIGR